MSPNLTVDEHFAVIVQQLSDIKAGLCSGFDSLEARFDKLDSRFEALDANWSDARFDKMEARQDRMEQKIDALPRVLAEMLAKR